MIHRTNLVVTRSAAELRFPSSRRVILVQYTWACAEPGRVGAHQEREARTRPI
jgi:hypothetical protein